ASRAAVPEFHAHPGLGSGRARAPCPERTHKPVRSSDADPAVTGFPRHRKGTQAPISGAAAPLSGLPHRLQRNDPPDGGGSVGFARPRPPPIPGPGPAHQEGGEGSGEAGAPTPGEVSWYIQDWFGG